MREHPDVLILGGGVIGLSTAWFLAQADARVAIVDKGDFGREASWAGAGILSPAKVEHARTALDRLRAHSWSLFPSLSQQLREETGIDNGFLVCGGFEVFQGADEEPSDEWQGGGIVFEELRGDELHRRYPELAPTVSRALFLPEMAQLRNPRHLKALQAALAARGVVMRRGCAVHRLARKDSRIEAVETDQGQLTADRYLLTAGAWSEALLEPLGWRPGIRPVRGQIALLNTGTAESRPLLLFGKRYLVPRGDGRVLVGSTEEDAGFAPHTTTSAITELLQFATAFVPSLASATVERCWAGLRPGSPDGRPFLGAVPGVDNLFIAAGHFRAGIQLSAGTAQLMKQLLLGEKLALSLEDFRLDRPPSSEP